MKIIEVNYTFRETPKTRSRTDYIVLHHRAGNGDAQSIHQTHLKNGWSGIGYHFYVRKDGSIYRGRAVSSIGAQAKGFNDRSVGVCFEGNYDIAGSVMPSLQKAAGREIVAYLKSLYPGAKVVRHGDLMGTACPGRNFPFDEIASAPAAAAGNNTNKSAATNNTAASGKSTAANGNSNQNSANFKPLQNADEISWELNYRHFPIMDMGGFISALSLAKEQNSPLYWGYYKIANQIKK